MAVRKFLDENGAAQLNDLLRTKFGTKRDKTDGLVIKEITDSTVRIWGMDEGIYTFSSAKTVYYFGETNTSSHFTASQGSILFIMKRTSETSWVLFNKSFVYYGYTDATYGSSANYQHSRVQLTTNKVTSLSSSSTDNQYPSAKCVYDALQAITPGEENVIESISVNGTTQPITNKNVDLTIPQITYSTTDLTPGTSPLNTGEIYVVYE